MTEPTSSPDDADELGEPLEPSPRAQKLQRWIDLLAALLARRTPATFDELARHVPAYAAVGKKPATLLRMFERDKDELRSMGVPIETVMGSDGEVAGYRLLAKDFYLPYLALAAGMQAPRRIDEYGYRALPTLALEPEDLTVIAEAAARVRSLGDSDLAAEAESALRKLAIDLPVREVALAPPHAAGAPSPSPAMSAQAMEETGTFVHPAAAPRARMAKTEAPRGAPREEHPSLFAKLLRAIAPSRPEGPPPAAPGGPPEPPPPVAFEAHESAPPEPPPPPPSEPPPLIDRLSDALARRKAVEFDYRSAEGEGRARRSVEPYGLFFVNGRWYLAARDILRGRMELYNFWLDRIENLAMSLAASRSRDYEIPQSFRLTAHARSGAGWTPDDDPPRRGGGTTRSV